MESIRASEIYRNAGFVLVALERVEYRQDKMKKLFQIYGRIEPIAVVICSPDTVTAIDMTGAPIAVDRLRGSIPNLDAILKPYLAEKKI